MSFSDFKIIDSGFKSSGDYRNFISGLEPKIGYLGGRYFAHKSNPRESVSLGRLIAQLHQFCKDSKEAKDLIIYNSVVRKYQLNKKFHDLKDLSKKNVDFLADISFIIQQLKELDQRCTEELSNSYVQGLTFVRQRFSAFTGVGDTISSLSKYSDLVRSARVAQLLKEGKYFADSPKEPNPPLHR